ncbi:outer membrane protein assembly factor BamD [Adhaeribacter radiodurans]|uniref:Outer membrane protein assembly factor BamD n=1 Tax=Adhaeribacter radiodurans TaxID=2745197 RepID=A0A7L7L3P6_9BACT|nr:outer membrane protein assembly factor BamD [Adhaeribacter radiodurans]QMU27400.1 outer membrane protein assembly factor BamD [Adhaeribacter radiodurans]
MTRSSYIAVLFAFFTLVLSACSDYNKILKSTSAEKKYEAALKYYEKQDYYRASTLLEELIPVLKGRPEAEKAQFYFAYTQFYQRSYPLSAFHFKSFYDTYPRSEYAEEALFMHAKSLYRDSPTFNLDQTSTYTAIEAIQDFLNRYPASKMKEEADKMYQELSAKVERKAFESARIYASMRYYQAAVTAFNNFQRNFPSSNYNEEALYLKLEAQYNLAERSVTEKQRERYFETVAYYQDLVDKFPKSKYLKDAENFYDKSLKQLEKLKEPANKEANTASK